MKKMLLVGTLLAITFGANAEEASQELKNEAQALIKAQGYQCKKVNNVFTKYFGGEVEVFCDDIYHYIIKDKGGRYIVEVQ